MKPLRATDPDQIGPYYPIAEIGTGGMGRVLLGASSDGRLVALKQVRSRLTRDPAFVARFRREVAASRTVSGAYTAAVIDADVESPEPWLASVFVPGPSLSAAVRQTGPLPVESVRRLAAGLASALIEIHRAGLIHRDLKPDNVLLAQDGPRVIDFGIVRAGEAGHTELTHAGTVVGSPGFMSPEQASGKEITAASDVFSLGAILVLAATGRGPFAGDSIPKTLYNVVYSEPDLSTLSPEVRRIAEPCLAKDPAARPSPAQLLELVGAITPAPRPWSSEVHGLIDAQQAEVEELLTDPELTVVRPIAVDPTRTAAAPTVDSQQTAGAPAVHFDQTADARPVAAPPAQPVNPPAQKYVSKWPVHDPGKPSSRTGVVVWSVVFAVLIAAAGIGAYLGLTRDDSKADSGAQPTPQVQSSATVPTTELTTSSTSTPALQPDKYAKVLTCAQMGADLPIASRIAARDKHTSDDYNATTVCYFSLQLPSADGELDSQSILWMITKTNGTYSGLDQMKHLVTTSSAYSWRDTSVGLGEDAYWEQPDSTRNCALNVQDGNLLLTVTLKGDAYPEPTCKSQAKEIARKALALTQRRF